MALVPINSDANAFSESFFISGMTSHLQTQPKLAPFPMLIIIYV